MACRKPWWRGSNPRSHHNCHSARGCCLGVNKLHSQWLAHAPTKRDSQTLSRIDYGINGRRRIRHWTADTQFWTPSIFKLWIDQIVTPSTLLERPLAGKRATFIIAAGRIYAPGSPDSNKNYLVTWPRTVFGSVGLSDMQFVIADGTKKVHSGVLDRQRSWSRILKQFVLFSPTNSIQLRSRLCDASNYHTQFSGDVSGAMD